MKNIFREDKRKNGNFTPISNDILQSKTLTPEEIGILVRFLSLPSNFEINATRIWNNLNIPRDKFRRAWAGLILKGHVFPMKYVDENTRKFHYRNLVFEIPQRENPFTGNQYTGETYILYLEKYLPEVLKDVPVYWKPAYWKPAYWEPVSTKKNNKKEKEKDTGSDIGSEYTGKTEQHGTPVDVIFINNTNRNGSIITGKTEQHGTPVEINNNSKSKEEMNIKEKDLELANEQAQLLRDRGKKLEEILNVGYLTKEQKESMRKMNALEVYNYITRTLKLPPMDIERMDPMIMDMAEMEDRLEEIDKQIMYNKILTSKNEK